MLTRLAFVARRCVPLILAVMAAIGVSMDGSYAGHAAPTRGNSAWTGDLDGMEKRRLIRILVPFSKTIHFIDRGEQLGTAVETGNAEVDAGVGFYAFSIRS
ncbi:hypothetical protein ILFOPFJJ_05732 [Ensifer psoraleae]|nr:hypothetical protein [Sinorhizobium psoraleae]